VQKHLSLTGHVYSPAHLPDEQGRVRQAESPPTRKPSWAAKEGREGQPRPRRRRRRQGRAELRSKGMQVVENVDKARFVAQLAPVNADFESQFGKANIDRIRNFK
jgi:TRAP-type transport system periplasmic protein